MRKMAVLNVGGALCAYLEIGENRVAVDMGGSETFNPVLDFLVPLFEKRGMEKDKDGRYKIDQLIISHPHKDHISAICDFNKYFMPQLLTCPNDKSENSEEEKVDLSRFDIDSAEVKCLREMYKGRCLPLTTVADYSDSDSQHLFYLKPGEVEEDVTLNSESYCNNISLVALFKINGYGVLLPGDIMEKGMEKLLADNPKFVEELAEQQICILVAPHHGLRSAFSTELFKAMRDGKTRCLNIVSEKKYNPNDNREVPSCYYSKEYCMGDNALESTNGDSKCYGRKTSEGHICVDFNNGSRPDITIIKDTDELIAWFE